MLGFCFVWEFYGMVFVRDYVTSIIVILGTLWMLFLFLGTFKINDFLLKLIESYSMLFFFSLVKTFRHVCCPLWLIGLCIMIYLISILSHDTPAFKSFSVYFLGVMNLLECMCRSQAGGAWHLFDRRVVGFFDSAGWISTKVSLKETATLYVI